MSAFQDFAMNSEMDYDQAVAELKREGVSPTPEAIAERKGSIARARRQAADERAAAAVAEQRGELTPEALAAARDAETVRRISVRRPPTRTGVNYGR